MSRQYEPNDKWARKAKEENFRARSVYKLQELDQRFRLLKQGAKVLDCGAAPGSWLQYVAERIGPKGAAVGIDLQEIKLIATNVKTFVLDICSEEAMRLVKERGPFDLVLSDLAPSTSGIKDVDQWRSIELSGFVLDLALISLKPRGHCVMKILRGADYDEFLARVKKEFQMVKTVTVKATRDTSREVYMVALYRK